jgi:hypothetical protein
LADITNKLFKYTGYQFADIEPIQITRDGQVHVAYLVGGADIPIVFTKPGAYEVDGRPKSAFAQGTVYFRHGAKSEPGNRDDLAAWLQREVARHRQELMRGMRKVVTAPRGHIVAVVPPGSAVTAAASAPLAARITADVNAARIVPGNAEEIWPHRQKDLLAAVNGELPRGTKINGHDLLCVNRLFDVLKTKPEFAYKPHRLASPQYSAAYAQWLVQQATATPDFFQKAREEYRKQIGGVK